MGRKRKYEITKKEIIEKWGKNYPNVMTWIGKLQRKDEAAWFLWRYCEITGKNPDELLKLKSNLQSREAEYLLDKFVADETSEVPNSIKVNIVISVKSFYKHAYCELAKACGVITLIKQKPYRKHTKEELVKIYRATQNPRDRALITFVFSTAIARETVSKIQWKHLEPDWQKQELPHIGLPDVLIKGHGRGKYKGVEQHTFLTPEAKRDLTDYKDWLERVKGVKLGLEDSIFIDSHHLQPPYKSIGTSGLGKVAAVLIRRSGVPFGWHDARRYVETALEETKINPNWARKIRGRKVRGEEGPYSRPAIEQLRQAYREAVPLLEFTQPTSLMEFQKRTKIVEELNVKVMEGQPLTEEDRANIKRYDIRIFKKKAMKPEDFRGEIETQTNGGDCGENFEQITESQLLSYLKAGWQIVHRLESGEVIVKR
jgi:hypothetical protein